MTTMTRTFRSDKRLCESKPRARTDPSKPVPPKKRPLQVPQCQGCRETEWHFSGRSPGEPDRGAPVVIKCHVCSCDWHVQCVAPGHTPGDEFDFFHDRWTWQRCDVESGALECGSSPLRPAHREAGGIRFQKAEAIEREWRRADELVSLVRFRGGTRLWLSKAACDGLPNELHARWSKSSARLAHAAAGDYALIAPVDTPTPIPGVAKRTWRFRANGQYFGVTQYLGAFSDQPSSRFESKTNKALLREEAK